jgi:cobalamin-dependent methionine synthase I
VSKQWTIIGERINPGFKSTRALFENRDIAGIQALAVKQAEAGASYLNVNTGHAGEKDHDFAKAVVTGIQQVVPVPLSFDSASIALQTVYLTTYDAAKAGGAKPMINSIAETHLPMLELLDLRPCKIIVMASERLEDGSGRRNTQAEEVIAVARRMLERTDAAGVPHEDIVIDVSISAMAADNEGLTRMALDAIKVIGSDPAMAGVHITGGLSNIGQQLPAKAASGVDLKHALECAFLTIATPLGFDTILGTPWKEYHFLPDDDYVMGVFRDFLGRSGLDALRQVRKLYKA